MTLEESTIYICNKLKEANITLEDLQKVDIEKIKRELKL